VKSLH
jgi:hypothetical protein